MGVAGVREGFLDRLYVQITGVLSCRSSPGSQHVKSRTSRESSSSSHTGVRPASVFGPGPWTSFWGREGEERVALELNEGQARGCKKGPRAGVL